MLVIDSQIDDFARHSEFELAYRRLEQHCVRIFCRMWMIIDTGKLTILLGCALVEATSHKLLKIAVQFKQYMTSLFSGSCVRKVRSFLRRVFISNMVHCWPVKPRFIAYLGQLNCCWE